LGRQTGSFDGRSDFRQFILGWLVRWRPHRGRTQNSCGLHGSFHASVGLAGRLASAIDRVLDRIDQALNFLRLVQIAFFDRVQQVMDEPSTRDIKPTSAPSTPCTMTSKYSS
jgi:hypothetical protein